MDDLILLQKPDIVVSDFILFASTYAGKLTNLHYSFEKLGKELSKDLNGQLLAVNSNFEHSCQIGFEKYYKSITKKNLKKKNELIFRKERQGQGDRTCFNSSVQLTISLNEHPNPNDKKIYQVKLFPTTGNVQVPGVNGQDLSDGLAVLEKTAYILNRNNIGDLDLSTNIANIDDANTNDIDAIIENIIAIEKPHLQIKIESHNAIMINYKFKILLNHPRLLINAKNFAKYIQLLEELQISDIYKNNKIDEIDEINKNSEIDEINKKKFTDLGFELINPPFSIRETKPPGADVKISFKFTILHDDNGVAFTSDNIKRPRINFFQEGKVNILGVNSIKNAKLIYNFFTQLFSSEINWKKFICIQKKPDIEIVTAKVRKSRKNNG